MENWRQETADWELVNLPVFHFRFSVSCFSFLPEDSTRRHPRLTPSAAMR